MAKGIFNYRGIEYKKSACITITSSGKELQTFIITGVDIDDYVEPEKMDDVEWDVPPIPVRQLIGRIAHHYLHNRRKYDESDKVEIISYDEIIKEWEEYQKSDEGIQSKKLMEKWKQDHKAAIKKELNPKK